MLEQKEKSNITIKITDTTRGNKSKGTSCSLHTQPIRYLPKSDSKSALVPSSGASKWALSLIFNSEFSLSKICCQPTQFYSIQLFDRSKARDEAIPSAGALVPSERKLSRLEFELGFLILFVIPFIVRSRLIPSASSRLVIYDCL